MSKLYKVVIYKIIQLLYVPQCSTFEKKMR